jgi:hypothetical protein
MNKKGTKNDYCTVFCPEFVLPHWNGTPLKRFSGNLIPEAYPSDKVNAEDVQSSKW